MFGRELTEVAPKAGRTDRAIVGDTLALAGAPVSAVGPFLAALERVAADGAVPGPVRPLPGAAAAVAALAAAGIRQSLLTGNVRPLAALKLRRAGLGPGLDLDAGAYGDAHEVRAELVSVARRAAGDPQLAERAQQVRLHRSLADEQGPADLRVGPAPRDLGQYLGLPGGQRLARRPAHVADQPFGDRWGEHRLAARGRPYRAG